MKVFSVVLLSKEVLSNQFRDKPVQFPGPAGLDILCSSLYTDQTREELVYCASQGPLYFFDYCRLGLFLANCAKGSNRSNCPWIRMLRSEIPSYLYGASKQVSECLKLPSRQCSVSWVLEYLLRFHSLPPLFRCLQSSRTLGMSSENFHEVIGSIRCGPARRWVCKHSWMCPRRAGRGGCGSSMAGGLVETCSPRRSGNGMSTSLPMRWHCAACGPCGGSGECRYWSRRKMSILIVSHILDHGRFEREIHKELIHICTEPCVVLWSLFIKSGQRLPPVGTRNLQRPGSSEPTPEEPLRRVGAQGGSGLNPPIWNPNSGVQGEPCAVRYRSIHDNRPGRGVVQLERRVTALPCVPF